MTVKTSIFRVCIASLTAIFLVACADRSNENHAEDSNASADSDSGSLPTAETPTLAMLLNGDFRSDADKARDANRKPAEVVAFLGIEPGMNVIDVIAGGGYYSEVLSLAVGESGRVSAQNPAVVLQLRDGANEKQLSERLADNRLPNVSRLDREIADLLPDDGPFDAALTALNLHDIYNNYGEPGSIGALKIIAATLKPGAVFGVIDHHGTDGTDNAALHRMRVEDAVRVFEAAGFIVEAQSGLLHVHNDDMTENVFAEGVRGKTHRFLFRLRKPE